MNIEYDHTKLYMPALHALGIRSTKDLEEVIEWPESKCVKDDNSLPFDVYVITGLTKACKGISIALIVSEDGKFVTLDASIPTRDELLASLLS